MYLAFTRVPGESYRRRFRSLLLRLCDVFLALINSPVCWLITLNFSLSCLDFFFSSPPPPPPPTPIHFLLLLSFLFVLFFGVLPLPSSLPPFSTILQNCSSCYRPQTTKVNYPTHETAAETAAVLWGSSHASTSVDIEKQNKQKTRYEKLIIHVESHASAVGLLEGGE